MMGLCGYQRIAALHMLLGPGRTGGLVCFLVWKLSLGDEDIRAMEFTKPIRMKPKTIMTRLVITAYRSLPGHMQTSDWKEMAFSTLYSPVIMYNTPILRAQFAELFKLRLLFSF